ncbi:hypothetical protein [Xenorhabdus beddingii]|uniref:hypothetical protein n=1 Tax=Xenorhabdus beddingii TaxID=40578 RepID=UPI001428C66A|nr:hypothetical protein [Xenorhabdus beddingii]
MPLRWLRLLTPVNRSYKHSIIYVHGMLTGINERFLPLTGGRPLAGQIRSLAAVMQLELF